MKAAQGGATVMRKYRFSLIRFTPSELVEEFVNIGVLLQDDSGGLHQYVPKSLTTTKVKRWFPKVNHEALNLILKQMIADIEQSASSKQITVNDLTERYFMGIFTVTPPRIMGSKKNAEEFLEELKKMFLDLRQTRGGGKILSPNKVRKLVAEKFRRANLLGTKVEEVREPIRLDTDIHIPPPDADFRWKNGVSQYVRIASLDRPESSTNVTIQNAWLMCKGIILDAENLRKANSGFTVVLQEPLTQEIGELGEIFDVTKYQLEKLDVPVFNLDNLDQLIKTVQQGKNLS